MIRVADKEDAAVLKTMAERAYARYVPRMGRKPAPMMADFAGHVERGEAWVVEEQGRVQGFVIQFVREGGWFVENLAVDPACQGRGHGGRLMAFAEAEAKARGLGRVFLYTNEKMTENLDFYARLGYAETARVTEQGFRRVYMEKRLSSCL